MEKAGLFTNKKVQAVAGTTDKLFCEEKRPEFSVEYRDPAGNSGLIPLVTTQRPTRSLGSYNLSLSFFPGHLVIVLPERLVNIY